MNITFNEWLRQRDVDLYNELSEGILDTAKSAFHTGKMAYGTARSAIDTTGKALGTAKSAWDTPGKVIGTKARNYAAAGALGAAALGQAMSGYPHEVEMVAKHNNMTPQAAYNLYQNSPNVFKMQLTLANSHDAVKNAESLLDKNNSYGSLKNKDSLNTGKPDATMPKNNKSTRPESPLDTEFNKIMKNK
jgi:hypothetical protein